jgi:outer membrane lipoprotein carrier protein
MAIGSFVRRPLLFQQPGDAGARTVLSFKPKVRFQVRKRGRMTKFRLLKALVIIIFFLFQSHAVWCENKDSSDSGPQGASIALDEIINGVEQRYAGSGFSADFFQESTLKAMEVTDTAFGKIFVKHPGMMRWEYEKPERQLIITNGKKLWIYRPEDNQVMTGNAPAYFGGGKGASFLSDIELIRKHFNITVENQETDPHYLLKLLPRENKIELSVIYLSISKKTFDIIKIITYNSYGDETQIQLCNFRYDQNLNDSLFNFKIPQGVDIVELEE